jgi:hypothetical protein
VSLLLTKLPPSNSGIDCFLFIVRYGRFKPEHEAALDCFARNVGNAALPHTLLCFTHCSLTKDELAEKLTSSAPPALSLWLGKVGGVVGVDNASDAKASRDRLHSSIEMLREAQSHKRYSNEALDAAAGQYKLAEEADRILFQAAVGDWRKGEGPIVIERST